MEWEVFTPLAPLPGHRLPTVAFLLKTTACGASLPYGFVFSGSHNHSLLLPFSRFPFSIVGCFSITGMIFFHPNTSGIVISLIFNYPYEYASVFCSDTVRSGVRKAGGLVLPHLGAEVTYSLLIGHGVSCRHRALHPQGRNPNRRK